MCRTLDLFLNSNQIKDYFICSICCGVICWNSWSMCKNEHIFCKQCLNDWLRNKNSCPSCFIKIQRDDDLSDRVMRFWKSDLACLMTKCSYNCGLSFSYESIDKHEQECTFNQVKCDECLKEFTPSGLREHRNSETINILASCWDNIINENKKLREDLKNLRSDCNALKESIHNLKKENNHLRYDNKRGSSIITSKHDLMPTTSSYRYQNIPSIIIQNEAKLRKQKISLVGTWSFEASENFEDYLKVIGVGFSQRKLISFMKPNYYIENNVYLWKIRQESKLKDTEINFYEGVEFEEDLIDGRPVRSKVNRDGYNRLVHTQRDLMNQISISTIVYEIIDEKLVLTYDAGGKMASRTFKRSVN